jgi:hypothetical protein
MRRYVRVASWCAILGTAVCAAVLADTTNGAAGQMPAFYCDLMFTINFKEQPASAEAALLAHNGSINVIYQSDQAVAGGFDFVSVINAFPGDGFNPLWQEVQIVFLTIPFTQFGSEAEILAAAEANEIMLMPTTQVYRCSVVGHK